MLVLDKNLEVWHAVYFTVPECIEQTLYIRFSTVGFKLHVAYLQHEQSFYVSEASSIP